MVLTLKEIVPSNGREASRRTLNPVGKRGGVDPALAIPSLNPALTLSLAHASYQGFGTYSVFKRTGDNLTVGIPIRLTKSVINLFSTFLAIVALVLLITSPPSHAQTSPMSLRYDTNTRGNIELIGNAIVTCSGSAQGFSCNQMLQQGYPSTEVSKQMIDIDGDAGTFNSSSADLTIPATANVLFAGLYWAATEGDNLPGTTLPPNINARTTVLFDTPATAGYQTINGALLGDATDNDDAYGAFADVTALVAAAGSGTYTTANIQVTNGTSIESTGPWGGWSLAVVYEESTEACRNLTVFDGFEVALFGTINVQISGFQAPSIGPVEADIGFFMGDGDIWNNWNFTPAPDSVQFDGQPLSDALNPYNASTTSINRNFFNNNLTRFGAQMTNRNPYTPHTLAIDITMIEADGILAPGSTSTTVTLDPNEGLWWPMMTAAIEIACPIEVTKTADTTTFDFGDAPDDYATLLVSNGPRHQNAIIPGTSVDFTVTVTNESAVDSYTLQTLNDSVYGDLNGEGTCSVPQTIPASGSYSCTFSGTVNGASGSQHVNIVSVSGIDAANRHVSGSDNLAIDIHSPSLTIGAALDTESNGSPNPTGTGDNLAGIDDEDGVNVNNLTIYNVPGVTFTATLPVPVVNNTSSDAQLVCWADFNQDENFIQSYDRSLPDFASHTLTGASGGPGTTVYGISQVNGGDPGGNTTSGAIGAPDNSTINLGNDGSGGHDSTTVTVGTTSPSTPVVIPDGGEFYIWGRTNNNADSGSGSVTVSGGTISPSSITWAQSGITKHGPFTMNGTSSSAITITHASGVALRIDAVEYTTPGASGSCDKQGTLTSFATGNVPAGCSGTATVQWTGIPEPQQGQMLYTRCRLTTDDGDPGEANFFSDSSPAPTGAATDGEVEDHGANPPPTSATIGQVSLDTEPVTAFLSTLVATDDGDALRGLLEQWNPPAAAQLADADHTALLSALGEHLDPDGDGRVAVLRWQTLEERGTIGFFVERRQGSTHWTRLNNGRMLPGLIDAPLGGDYLMADPEAISGAEYLYRLIEQEAWGTQKAYGPYSLRL